MQTTNPTKVDNNKTAVYSRKTMNNNELLSSNERQGAKINLMRALILPKPVYLNDAVASNKQKTHKLDIITVYSLNEHVHAFNFS